MIEEIERQIQSLSEEASNLETGPARNGSLKPALIFAVVSILGVVALSVILSRESGKPSEGELSSAPRPFAEASGPGRDASPRRGTGYAGSTRSSSNLDLELAIETIATVYPELSREELIRKLKDISGLPMRDSSDARQARQMVETYIGIARQLGRSELEFFDYSERKRIELEKSIGGASFP